jgi:pimeloyl-ACP methyl ester carboxylesterase
MSVFFREAGSGPGVVCLHSNASSSAQWRALMDILAPKFHALAADSYGAGKSPARPKATMLRDEVALLEPVFERAGDPFALVGHSYGGAVALVAAALHPQRVRALALYEPTLFALVERESPRDVDGIRNTVDAAVSFLQKGDTSGAARAFIDFWMEPGAFDRMPERNREAIAAAGTDVVEWRSALFGEPTPPEAFARLEVPVLLLVGKRSPLSSRAVAQLLARTLPKVNLVELDGCGHMAPVVQPDKVNGHIARFLQLG